LSLILAVEKSGDRKLTEHENVSATYAPQPTCPPGCPLLRAGCYAEQGLVGLHTHRLNRKARELALTPAKLARLLADEEANLIRTKLTGKRKLRVHVVGDAATRYAARKIGLAMRFHERKHGKVAWTYTHGWKEVPIKSWNGARVLASCHSVGEALEARDRGYRGVALTTVPHPTHRVYQLGSLNVIPCPAQFFRKNRDEFVRQGDGKYPRLTTCERCSICQRPDELFKRNMVVGFQPDHGSDKRLLKLIAST
jgi:hypothetical protein